MQYKLTKTFIKNAASILTLLACFIIPNSHAESERIGETYNRYIALNTAVIHYYLMLRTQDESEQLRHRASLNKALLHVNNVQPTSNPDASPSTALIDNIANSLVNGVEFYMKNGYPYAAGDAKMEENYENLYAVIASARPNSIQVAEVYENLTKTLHYYCAYHASIGGDTMNPVIANTDIGNLVDETDQKLASLVAGAPKDRELSTSLTTWRFLAAGIKKWQTNEIVYLVSRYYPDLTQVLVSRM